MAEKEEIINTDPFICNKEYKYTVGESIKKETIEMIINIYRANSRKDKVKHIVKARENIEVIWVLLRLLRDLKQVNIKKFAGLNDKCESVSKQLNIKAHLMPQDRELLLEKLFETYYSTRKNKRNTHSCAEYEVNYEGHLIALCDRLLDKTYNIKGSVLIK
ncbi:MAG: hypothetical protein Ctma_0050 [Catillopecten margaritatus gill symbiont]|uniref:Uncharacterized protein n=1 Tax=Catillopecten margaritatus gill symbiont TaxID=3083288 RepID=A0AAU6PEA6_9GAMM